MDANGHYWRRYPGYFSIPPHSTGNDPVPQPYVVYRPVEKSPPLLPTLLPDQVERLASVAFESDAKGGHHKDGPWTWHMIGPQGQENYQRLVRDVLTELERLLNA